VAEAAFRRSYVLCALQPDCLGLRLRFDDIRLHFRRFERHEHLPLSDRASSVHSHALDEAREFRVNRNREVRLELAGQLDLPIDRFRRHADDFDGRGRRHG
jgi:hypothetical protein